MQELLLVTNRRTRFRATVVGGGVAGLLVGVCLSSIAGFMLSDRQQNSAVAREASLKAGYEAQLSTARERIKDKERTFSGAPLSFLAQRQEANVLQLQRILAQFPPFKSDVYKGVFANLVEEVERQAKDSQELRTVLTSADSSPSSRCVLATKGVVTPSLWSSGAITFHREGWRGFSHE